MKKSTLEKVRQSRKGAVAECIKATTFYKKKEMEKVLKTFFGEEAQVSTSKYRSTFIGRREIQLYGITIQTGEQVNEYLAYWEDYLVAEPYLMLFNMLKETAVKLQKAGNHVTPTFMKKADYEENLQKKLEDQQTMPIPQDFGHLLGVWQTVSY